MKIVKLKGGLGNQMFQYAFALLLEKRTKEHIILDYSAYQSLKNDTVRVPRIVKFNLSLQKATENQIRKVCYLRHKGNSQTLKYRMGIWIENKINRKYYFEVNRAYVDPATIISNSYFDGYWQSWRYVAEVIGQIRRDFVPRESLSDSTCVLQKEMKEQNAVFIGVRRGDYGKEIAHYGSFGTEYYEKAMAYIDEHVKKPVYYIFSNDIEWCKKNIRWGNRDIHYRDKKLQTSDFEELMLMASCKHAIIVNSSFHWWGATLINNPKKIICCPSKWFFDSKPIEIIPREWIKIENEF